MAGKMKHTNAHLTQRMNRFVFQIAKGKRGGQQVLGMDLS